MRQNVYDYSYEMRNERNKRVSFVLLLILAIFASIAFVRNVIVYSVVNRSDMMEGDLVKNSMCFVQPLSRNPKRGYVVLLNPRQEKKLNFGQKIVSTVVNTVTFNQVYPFQSGSNVTAKPCLRRVLGLPGDTIYMKDYILYIKPAGQTEFLTEYEFSTKPYNLKLFSGPAQWDGLGPASEFEEFTLGSNEYFVLADNRISGTDSRLWGPVKASSIGGRVICQFMPVNKFKFF